ncbi:MAG TPA: hypothetical protein DDY13_14645 [Cytophagales bacterium]|jgi:hypothetical protein|nr:hypothetical protein [Cytophagales bacterium]
MPDVLVKSALTDVNTPLQTQFSDPLDTKFGVDELDDELNNFFYVVYRDLSTTLSSFVINYVLLIATDSYDEMQKLSNTIFDATTISTEMEENYGFETEIVINPTRNTLLSVIRKYSKRLYADEDQLFIFYCRAW